MRSLLVVVLLLGLCPWVLAEDSVGFETGVALTPRHFPRQTADDVAEMFDRGRAVGPYAASMWQWSQPDLLDVAAMMSAACSGAGLKPMFAVSPTRLDKRDQIDAPKALVDKVGDRLSFSNPVVVDEFSKTVLALARLKPAYLCLATEINFLAFRDIKEYVAFAEACKKLYPRIKELSPDTKVFVSFQWDIYRVMDQKEPSKIAEHSKLIDVFRPALDVVAFTSYPGPIAGSAEKLPADYYDGIRQHVTENDTVIFSELGWPTAGHGSEASQAAFIQRLPALFSKAKPQIVTWSLLHDVQIVEFNADLGTTGLLQNDGKEKAGWAAFKALKQK